MLEKTLESTLGSKGVKVVNPKVNQVCIFSRRTEDESEAPTLWPSNAKCPLLGKDPDAGKDQK